MLDLLNRTRLAPLSIPRYVSPYPSSCYSLSWVQAIKDGNLDFDHCVATPDMMSLVGSVARILVSATSSAHAGSASNQ